ncbi:hypothetical protein [Ralstonia sp. 1138]|uniref:hypothetical protein n=1 Tax=Ralstonia sp. 1138 TaxID=3156423 RepID=UPI00339777D4
MFPPFGSNGHTLYRREANDLTEPEIDAFLRHNHLPAQEKSDAFEPLLARLGMQDRKNVDHYLRAPTEKALAVPIDGQGVYWGFAYRSIGDACERALKQCRAATGRQCRLIGENLNLLATWNETLELMR